MTAYGTSVFASYSIHWESLVWRSCDASSYHRSQVLRATASMLLHLPLPWSFDATSLTLRSIHCTGSGTDTLSRTSMLQMSRSSNSNTWMFGCFQSRSLWTGMPDFVQYSHSVRIPPILVHYPVDCGTDLLREDTILIYMRFVFLCWRTSGSCQHCGALCALCCYIE